MKILPEPHRYAVCCMDDMPIKEFYKGVFEEVFVILHPFLKHKGSTNNINPSSEKVTWKQFLSLSGIGNYKQLDIGLRTRIKSLKKEYEDEKTASIIEKICRENLIVEPQEGMLPPVIMDDLLKGLQTVGHDWIWIGDEFCTERKLVYINDLMNDNHLLDQRKNLFTHDHSILITTPWDSHFSLLCSNRETVGKLVNLCELEGFYCTDKTKINWSTSSDK